MVIEGIALLFFGLIDLIFGLFTIPATPVIITQAVTNVTEYFSIPIGLTRVLLTDSFVTAAFTAVVAYILIEPLILLTKMIYNMVRGSGA